MEPGVEPKAMKGLRKPGVKGERCVNLLICSASVHRERGSASWGISA